MTMPSNRSCRSRSTAPSVRPWRWTLGALCAGLVFGGPAMAQGRNPTHAAAVQPSSQTAAGTVDQTRKRIAMLATVEDITPILAPFGLSQENGSARKGVWKIQVPPGTSEAELELIVTGLNNHPDVIFAEPDRLGTSIEVGGCLIDDQGVIGQAGPQQCTVAIVDGIPTIGAFKGQYALDQMDAKSAQRLPHPFAPVVAVIDTGIDPGHPLLANNLYGAGFDFVLDQKRAFEHIDGVDNDKDGLIDEAFGHGTHMAGSVLAVAPWALILPVRCLDTDGNGSGFDIAAGIFYAVDAGVDVINLSLSFEIPSLSVVSALQYAEAKGVIVVTSAGNTGGAVLFPGNYHPADYAWKLPELEQVELDGHTLVTVAAVDADDVKAAFSAWGPDIDVCAPGVAIYSAFPGGGFAWWSGTSMATALVSGAAALTVGIGGPFPDTTASDLLIGHADPIDDSNPDFAGGLGQGRVNALLAGLDALNP